MKLVLEIFKTFYILGNSGTEILNDVIKIILVVKVVVAQLCPTLYDHMDYSLPDSSVHGIL